jgi:hypothetical protein
MKDIITKYLWLIPALYVSYEFAGKLFEVLADPQEFMDIISVIKPFASISNFLAHFIGYFDFAFAVSLLLIPSFIKTKKYANNLFAWAIFWPFLPASLRYFGGVGDFELIQVLSISISAFISLYLYKRYSERSINS